MAQIKQPCDLCRGWCRLLNLDCCIEYIDDEEQERLMEEYAENERKKIQS
jgi:hypothetical protein